MPIDHSCPDCGNNLLLDPGSLGRTSCRKCGTQLEVINSDRGNKMVRRVKPFGPKSDYTDKLLIKLNELEQNSLEESAITAGQGAYIASEFMALRALEAVSRRITDEDSWNDAINKIEDRYGDLSGYISMLRDRRNEVAHPDAVESTEDQAKRTFEQVKHMLQYMEDDIDSDV